jgi:4-hydroxy-tetrahydrodipicolinate reductase
MKIALIGYGKMGKLIEQEALAKGHEIVARFSRQWGTVQNRPHDLAQADLAIDFSRASVVLDHLQICLSFSKPLVIGTTGWEEQRATAQKMVRDANGSCLHAPNFSIGVYLFQQITRYAASLFQPFTDYDVSGVEYHHRHKLDSPSGTAKTLTQNILHQMPRLNDLTFSSVRCGHIPGTHTLHFEGPTDSLIFTHQAHHRQGFADGAIMSAEWLRCRQGFYTFEDMMGDYTRK